MGGVRRRIEEDELHRHAHGGGVGAAIPASSGLHDDARPSRRPRSFQRRHRYFSLQRHGLQPTRNPLFQHCNSHFLLLLNVYCSFTFNIREPWIEL